MATTAGSILGNYAPAMQEPYAIETPLANAAISGDPRANSLLNSYWVERQQREGDYAQRLAGQMAFGQQFLKEQQQEAMLKGLPEAAKTGLLPAFASTGLLANMDPAAIDYANQQNAAASKATNLGNLGRAMQGAGAGGYQLNIPDLSNVAGIGITPGVPTSVQAQAMANQGRIGAAQIRAAAGGGPGAMTFSTNPDPAVGGIQFHGKIPPQIAAQGKAAIDAYVQGKGFGGPAQAPSPYSQPGTVNTAPPPVIQPRTQTGLQPAPQLPMAKTDTPANAPAPVKTTQTAKVLTPQQTQSIVGQVKQMSTDTSLPPAMRQDLANPRVTQAPDGSIHVFGASGKEYKAQSK